jgi:hypothetical protein
MSGAIRFVIVSVVLVVTLSMRTAWGTGKATKLERHDVKLYVTATKAPGVGIGVDLEYIGRVPIRIYKSGLPWGIRHSMILVVMCLDGVQTLIPELEYMSRHQNSWVTFGSGNLPSA